MVCDCIYMMQCECLWQAILLGLGLQHRSVESLSEELNNLAVGQILGIFNQLIRQIQTVSFSLCSAKAVVVCRRSYCHLYFCFLLTAHYESKCPDTRILSTARVSCAV